MASKSSNQGGGSSTNQGNREQFDHFDRLSRPSAKTSVSDIKSGD